MGYMAGLTEEQEQAYSNLKIAIEECFKAHNWGYEGDNFVLSEFLVLTAMQKLGNEGEIYTVYPVLFKDGDMPWHIIHGLMHKHMLEMNRQSVSHEDNG